MNKICIAHSPTGGGKSTLCKRLAQENQIDNPVICSADDYHYFEKEKIPENYKFDLNNLYHAHKECKRKFTEAIANAEPLIIVDNTNIKSKDYKFYFLTAVEFGYEVEFHSIINGTVEQHFKSNVHNVPRAAVEAMVAGFKPVPSEIDGYTTKEIFYDFNELRKNK